MAQANKLSKQFARADLERAVRELDLSDPVKITAATEEVKALVFALYRREQWITSTRDRRAQLDYIEKVRKHLDGLRESFKRADPGIKKTFGGHLAKPLARISPAKDRSSSPT